MPQDFNDKVFDELFPLAPQGSAPASKEGVKAPGTQLRDLLGGASNVIGMGSAGAQLGSMFGSAVPGIGTLAGGVGGGLAGIALGALLPPSETPMTDLGATAAEGAIRLLPGGGPIGALLSRGRMASKLPRLTKAAGEIGDTALGAALGAVGDRALGFQKETPWGNVTLYSALATPGAILGSIAAKTTPAAKAADRIGGFPMSVSETTGILPGYENMLTAGSRGSKALGLEQSQAALSALNKINGAPLEEAFSKVLNSGIDAQHSGRDAIQQFATTWEKMNLKTVTKKVGSGVYDANGKEVMKTVTQKVKGPDWTTADFDKFFKLTPEEGNEFRRFLGANPDAVVDTLLPRGENNIKGILKFRAIMSVLDQSNHQQEAGNLGQAFVMRYLREPFEKSGGIVDGKEVAARIMSVVGDSKEPGHLVTAVGPDRAEALRDLATVLRDANPLEKIAGEGVSAPKRAGTYLFNKIAFAAASAGALGAFGHNALPLGELIVGMGAGAVVGVGIPTVIGAIMSNPKTSKLLLQAAKGDSTAGTRFIRTITSSAKSENNRDGLSMEDVTPSAASNRLRGLFIKQ